MFRRLVTALIAIVFAPIWLTGFYMLIFGSLFFLIFLLIKWIITGITTSLEEPEIWKKWIGLYPKLFKWGNK